MPIKSIFWGSGMEYDLHVFWGNPSPDLSDTFLFFVDSTGANHSALTYQNSNADVTLTFTPQFKRKSGESGNTYTYVNGGISVDMTTGVVTTANPVPSPMKRNFLIVASAVSGASTYTKEIRVHIHNSVSKVWLTPSVLTVRPFAAAAPETTEYKFSVRAQFDDGTVGDITENHNVTWNDASGATNNNVDSDGSLIIAAGNTAGQEIDIRVTLPALMGATAPNNTATAKMKIGDRWTVPATTTVVSYPSVRGGYYAVDKAPNILFLCDGFKSEDSATFESMLNNFLNGLKSSKVTRPFDLVFGSMNFWYAFNASSERGISTLCEMYLDNDPEDGILKAYAIREPKKPDYTPGKSWVIENLIYAVGLPMPADDISNAARTNAAIKTEWTQLHSPDPVPFLGSGDSLINLWRRMGKRTLIEEMDSYFGLNYGSRPAAVPRRDKNSIGLNPNRISRDNLNNFLMTIAGPGADVNGQLWAENPPGTRPKNFDYIFILSSMRWDRGVNYEGYIAMNAETRKWVPVAQLSGTNAHKLNITSITSSVNYRRILRSAHELAHSFGLGDEYSEGNGNFTGTAASLEVYGNLQDDSSVRLSGNINSALIKWNWHRITKAGVISAPITAEAGGKFRVPLKTGHGIFFANGDSVFLRFRNPPTAVLASYFERSDELVIAEAPTANAVVFLPKAGSSFLNSDIAHFPPGSIIYKPTPAPDSIKATIPYARMVAKKIEDYIDTNNRPLTVSPCVKDTGSTQTPSLDGVSLPTCFKYKNSIIGLYSGGRMFDCGIYHPSGNCIMRYTEADEGSGEFCAVCRYIIVDIIDPSMHFEIDIDYGEKYPQT
jgi:hypothetical protein